MSEPQTSLPLTSSAEDSPAKTSRWLDAVRAWLEAGADCGTNSMASFVRSLPVGFSSRTCLACFPRMEDGTYRLSSEGWRSSGMGGPTGCLTFDTSDRPSAGAASSLSDILGAPCPVEVLLEPESLPGILRRAKKRGKTLPTSLRRALLMRAREQAASPARTEPAADTSSPEA